MIHQAIILAGGKGTRLREVVSDLPKPMAQVAGKPFLTYVLDELKKYGITKTVLSVGYMHEVIMDYFGGRYGNMELYYAVEDEPLGTGGGIKKATDFLSDEPFYLVNGDTLYSVDLQQFGEFYKAQDSDISIALKQMKSPDRYGTVELDGNRITSFREKQSGLETGWINAGVYILSAQVMNGVEETVFSFESKILEQGVDHLQINGWKTDGYFIDIGIPEDFKKANEDLKETGN